MNFLLRLYRLGSRAYPSEFRAHYAQEMCRVFAEKFCEVRRSGWLGTVWYCVEITADLIIGAARERLAILDWAQAAAAVASLLAGTFTAYVDFHASEVQVTLLVLIATSFTLGFLMPKRPWRWALIVAAMLPAIHVASLVLHGQHPPAQHPYFSRLMIGLPASVASLFGAYTGVLLRFLGREIAGADFGKNGPNTSGPG